MAPRRLNALFITSFGALAMVIAMVGIAGVLAFSVSSRIAEIGIRMSLGADAGRVRRMVLGEGGAMLGDGVGGRPRAVHCWPRGCCAACSSASRRTIRSRSVRRRCSSRAVGVAACWLPAARAARVDPAVALRAE